MGDPDGSPSPATGRSTRDAIVAAAWSEAMDVDASQLLAGVSLRRVAAAAGVSPGTLAYHIPSAAELGRAMAEQLVAQTGTVAVDDALDALRDLAVTASPWLWERRRRPTGTRSRIRRRSTTNGGSPVFTHSRWARVRTGPGRVDC